MVSMSKKNTNQKVGRNFGVGGSFNGLLFGADWIQTFLESLRFSWYQSRGLERWLKARALCSP